MLAAMVGACADQSEQANTSMTGSSGGSSGSAAKTGMEGGAASGTAADRHLVFLDSRTFDEDLSSALGKGSDSVTVDVPGGFNLNKIPERMDRWLYAVKDSGGKVAAKPEEAPRTRSLIAALLSVAVAVFEKIDEMRLYQPSHDYDATLLYRGDGTVNKVVFDRRSNAPA